jgi:hypothetical protein
MISGTIQIVFAICLVIILLIIGFATYNYEFMKAIQESSTSVVQKTVPIFVGIKDIKNTSPETYTVTNKIDPSYRDIQPSVNQQGGIEFSYSFWLFNKGASAPSNNTPLSPDDGYEKANQIVLFVKGSNEQFTYNNICGNTKTDFKIKCPLVKLENGRSQLTVEFNTLVESTDSESYPEAIKQKSRDMCEESSTDWEKANAHKLTIGNLDSQPLNGKWILVTIIMKDTVPSDSLPHRNKAHCSIYINNFKELDTYVDGRLYDIDNAAKSISTIKPNNGNLYFFPHQSTTTLSDHGIEKDKTLMVGSLTYYNYAISQNTIENTYTAGVPTVTAASVAEKATYDDVLEVSSMYNSSLTNDSAIARRVTAPPNSN